MEEFREIEADGRMSKDIEGYRRISKEVDHLRLYVALTGAARLQRLHVAAEGFDATQAPGASEDLGLVEEQPQAWDVAQAQLLRRRSNGRDHFERLVHETGRGKPATGGIRECEPQRC